jgi:hypothetical protein
MMLTLSFWAFDSISAGSVFNNQLAKKLRQFAPQVNPTPIRQSVAAIYSTVEPQFRGAVIHAYAKAVRLSHQSWLSSTFLNTFSVIVRLRLPHWNRNCPPGFFVRFSYCVSDIFLSTPFQCADIVPRFHGIETTTLSRWTKPDRRG